MHGVFANGRMTFTTSHFSTYEVVYEDIQNAVDPVKSDDDKEGLPLALIIGGGVAVLALIAIVVILIRRRA